MSAFALAMLFSNPDPEAALLASGDMLPLASERLSNCVAYNAIRDDDGLSDVADLISAARVKCAVNLGIWRYFTRGFIEAKDSQVDTDTVAASSERVFFETITAKVSAIIEAGRRQ